MRMRTLKFYPCLLLIPLALANSSPKLSYAEIIGSVLDRRTDDDDQLYGNATSINYAHLYDQSSPNFQTVHDLDRLKYQFQKVARTGRLFTPNQATAEFALEWKVTLVEIDFMRLFRTGTLSSSERDAPEDDRAEPRSLGSDGTKRRRRRVFEFNQSALLASGAVLIGSMIMFPSITQSMGLTKDHRNEPSGSQIDLIDKIDEYLKSFGVDGNSCMNLMVCSAAEKVKSSAISGSVGSLEQVMDGLMQLEIVKDFLKASRFGEAIDMAYNEDDCDAEFSSCPFSIGMMESMFNGWLQKVFPEN